MSRSRKKVGGFTDSCPYMKRYANRRLRRLSPEQAEYEFGGGKSNITRRYTCPWDICDWKDLYFSMEEVRRILIRFPHLSAYYETYHFYNK